MIYCGMAVKRMGMLEWVWGRCRHWLWILIQLYWLIEVDRIRYYLCTNCKIFFLSKCFIFWWWSQIWIKTFSVGKCALFGGCLRLESSCIWVSMVTLPSIHDNGVTFSTVKPPLHCTFILSLWMNCKLKKL